MRKSTKRLDIRNILREPRPVDFLEYLVGASLLARYSGMSFSKFRSSGVRSEYVDDHSQLPAFEGDTWYTEDTVVPQCYRALVWAAFGNPDCSGSQVQYLPVFKYSSEDIYRVLTWEVTADCRRLPSLSSGASEAQLRRFTAYLCSGIMQSRHDAGKVFASCSVSPEHLWDKDVRKVHQSFSPLVISRMSSYHE